MGRLIGYLATRTDRLAEALTEQEGAIGPASIESDAWGMGFYQGGEVLHKKRPRGPEGAERLGSWADVVGTVRTDCALIHFRTATVGDFRSENTHPFRMRQWLFAHTGTVHGFSAVREPLLDSLPDFLRRNIRGTTDSEHVFHVILSFLHDSGQLDNPDIEPKVVLGAIRSTFSMIDRLVSEVGAPPATLSCVLTNGRQMIGARRGAAMSYVLSETVEAGRPPSTFRYAMIASSADTHDAAADHVFLADDEAVVVSRDLSVRRERL
jgi:predicted glutamine amidotransferase